MLFIALILGAPSEYLSDDELLYRAFSQKLFSNDNGKLKLSMELARSKLVREEEEVSCVYYILMEDKEILKEELE